MNEGGGAYSIRLLPSGEEVEGSARETVLDTCIKAGLPVPYNCRSGECGECMAALLSGEVEELPGADPAIFTDAHRDEGNILACMCYPRSAIVINVPMQEGVPAIRPQSFHVMVERVEKLTPTIYGVTVETPWPVEFRPGQCFEWALPGISPNRTYSAANAPGSERIEFHVRVYPGGKVSEFVSGLGAGNAFELVGPFGHFGLSANGWRGAICVAGGTGLAPILSALEAAAANGDRRRTRLFYGARNKSELYCLDRLEALGRANPDFEFVPVLSEEPEASDWRGHRGTVTDILSAELGDAFGCEAYVCGPPIMIDKAVAVLENAGLVPEDIRTDRFAQAR